MAVLNMNKNDECHVYHFDDIPIANMIYQNPDAYEEERYGIYLSTIIQPIEPKYTIRYTDADIHELFLEKHLDTNHITWYASLSSIPLTKSKIEVD